MAEFGNLLIVYIKGMLWTGLRKGQAMKKSSFDAVAKRLQILKEYPQLALSHERVVFVPGAVFVLLGLCTLVAPTLIIFLFAALFLFMGAFFCFVAWRFLQLKRKVEDVVKNFESRVIIQGVQIQEPVETEIELEGKNIVFH